MNHGSVLSICKAYESGMSAALGSDEPKNPYPPVDVEYEAWKLGFNEGKAREVAATEVFEDLGDEDLSSDTKALQEEVIELRRGFELRWRASIRAMERWRAEDPVNRELIMPDHADLCVWLLEQLEAKDGDQGRSDAVDDTEV